MGRRNPASSKRYAGSSFGQALVYSRCCCKHPVESELAEWARKKKLYIEIGESWIYQVEVKPDFTGVIGDPVLMLRPPATLADRSTD